MTLDSSHAINSLKPKSKMFIPPLLRLVQQGKVPRHELDMPDRSSKYCVGNKRD